MQIFKIKLKTEIFCLENFWSTFTKYSITLLIETYINLKKKII